MTADHHTRSRVKVVRRRVSGRRVRGVTLPEALFAAFLTAVILTFTLSLYVTGMMAWLRGEGNILSETGSDVAIRVVANEMRQAMNVVVDANGNGLTYNLPLQANGTDVIPISTDGVTRRIELDGSSLNMLANGAVTRTICKGVILTDPLSPGGTQAYKIFTPSAGSITRSITVEVANRASSYQAETISARNRETIFLRNIPQISY
jgi:hypothetical protein